MAKIMQHIKNWIDEGWQLTIQHNGEVYACKNGEFKLLYIEKYSPKK